MSAKREKSVAELVERAFEDGYLLGYEAGKSEESLRRSNMADQVGDVEEPHQRGVRHPGRAGGHGGSRDMSERCESVSVYGPRCSQRAYHGGSHSAGIPRQPGCRYIPDWSDAEAASPRSIPYREVLRALELDLSELEKRATSIRASIASLQSLVDAEAAAVPSAREARDHG